MDTVNLKITPRATDAHLFRVPCSFSPTGTHYVVILLGKKHARIRNREYPYLLYVSSECADTVPHDVLDGMAALREGADKTQMCFEVLKSLKDVFKTHETTRGMSRWERQEKAAKIYRKLPASIRPIVERTVDSALYRAGGKPHAVGFLARAK